MFVKTFELLLRLSILYILVGSEDALINSEQDKSTNNYFSIMKNLPVFFEYLTTCFLGDESQVLDENNEEEPFKNVLTNAEETYQYTKYDRVALTPEEVVEQILKVEHELEEYNDYGEL